MVELHESNYLLAVREEEEPHSLVHRLGEAVIGEGVGVRASGEEVVETRLGFFHECNRVVVVVLEHLVGVDPLVLVLARVGVLLHEVLVLEIVHGGPHERTGYRKMRWHAELLHIEPISFLELFSEPAKDVASRRLGEFAEAGAELYLLIEILRWEVEDEGQVRPFILPSHQFPLLGHPLETFVDGQPNILLGLRMTDLDHNSPFILVHKSS